MRAVRAAEPDSIGMRLAEQRLAAFGEAEAELLRLAAHPYFRGTRDELGLRTAVSAVRRLLDSADIRCAEDGDDLLEVWDDIAPGSLAAKVRRLPAVDSACRECGRDYRKCAAGPYVCVHRADCTRGHKLAA